MAIFCNPSRENIRQQIQQINFILGNPLHPVCKLFLSYWTAAELEARRESLVKLYRTPTAERRPMLQPLEV